jgi:hypothetical protein
MRRISMLLVILVLMLLSIGCSVLPDAASDVALSAATFSSAPAKASPVITAPSPSPTLSPSSIPSVAAVPSNTAEIRTMTGTFVRLEWGDYLHLYICTKDGNEAAFWVLSNVGVDSETLKAGQEIEISWENRNVYIEEADEIINMDVATSIRVLSG